MGEDAFGTWGWRIPFLLSAILLAVSLWIRLKLNELPLFRRMVEEGKQSRRPLLEAFGQWDNLKIAILALFGATAGEAVVWYGGQFYALFFLTQTLQGSRRQRADHDRGRARDRHALLRPVRLALRQDRPQTDHARRLCACSRDLLPDLSGHYPLRQSKAGTCADGGAGDGDRRPGQMFVPVQGDGNGKIHHAMRHHQGRAGRSVGELRKRSRTARNGREREDRRTNNSG